MANPKRKVSKSKRDLRRFQWKTSLQPSSVSKCSNCGATKLSHTVCPECGYYKGRRVILGTQS